MLELAYVNQATRESWQYELIYLLAEIILVYKLSSFIECAFWLVINCELYIRMGMGMRMRLRLLWKLNQNLSGLARQREAAAAARLGCCQLPVAVADADADVASKTAAS